MDITIPGHKIKTFTRALQCINKFGDELSFHATANNLKLSTISAARSAFCLFTFDPSFFSRYRITAKARKAGDPIAVQLQILGKTLHDIFKQKAVASALKITLSIPAADFQKAEAFAADEANRTLGSQECRLTVTIHCAHGIKKTYRLTYAAGACLIALANKAECQSVCTASPRVLKEWTDHFAVGKHGTDEITLWYTRQTCKLKSFQGALDIEPYPDSRQTKKEKEAFLAKQNVDTTLTVQTDEFERYEIGSDEALITISLKEFKAVIDFAVGVGDSVDLHFQVGGEPLIAALETDALNIEFVLSTNADDPAGVQREKDVKPRLTQVKLPSVAPTLPGSGSRANSKVPERQPTARPSVTPAPSNRPVSRQASIALPPSKKNGTTNKPLFAPEEDEETQQEEGGNETTRVTVLDDDDDDEAMWNRLDQDDPSFSQAAIELDESTRQQRAANRSRGSEVNDTTMESNNGADETEESVAVPRARSQAAARQQPEIIDMSLDEEEDDSMASMVSTNGGPKRPRKNWQLGI